jgi:6,7-dimethyl-8-ribityllumazine synthase
MSKGITFPSVDGKEFTIGVVKAMWNSDITDPLYEGCLRALRDCHVPEDKIVTLEVPGSFELPYGALTLIEKRAVDAVVCLGVLIKGETMHFEYISEAVAHGIQNLSLDSGVPVIFGVLTCLNESQAVARSQGDNNHGYGWGMSAVTMAKIAKS